ncbi:hypothetical protein LIX60_04590 [Streptomyces sp. S07_1.15]|uniref:NucA/NucB deoxyribonuclease domain-containing protein n=1 Tax=Streptomyces sp. S07_1.15 TaxID=2873925 RepID=UPI001D14C1AF|nr:NucA/NucB deoxyribonuclease domain-containing protein [Streptomyces sp. S07_1.15]MCC3650767.1 hypothetical protein [Streptomyces sp. S07_1.15]
MFHIALTRWTRALATACTLTLAATATAVAAPQDRVVPQPHDTVAIVDAATLPPEQLRGLDEPIPFGEYLASRSPSKTLPAAAEADDTDLRQECADHAEAAKTAKGWIKSRFESCQKKPYDLVLRDTRGSGRTLGRMWFDVWVLGFAHDGARKVEYAVSVEDITVQPAANEDATKWRISQSFTHSINATESDPNPRVNAPGTTTRDETLTGWHNNPYWTLTYTSPDTGKVEAGNPQRVNAVILMTLGATSPNASPSYSEVDAFHSGVRFDRAGARAGKHQGTVFTEARVELQLSLSDEAIKESTRHIRDALQYPERTFPSWPGKSIPGKDEPLHRLIDEKKQEDNRDVAIDTCHDIWGDYSGTGLQCDEYPFASTKEGANAGDDRYSARLIDGPDNEAGGRRLNSMYTANRILDGDPFYVKINP